MYIIEVVITVFLINLPWIMQWQERESEMKIVGYIFNGKPRKSTGQN